MRLCDYSNRNKFISQDNNDGNDVCRFNMIILEYFFNIAVGSESRIGCMIIIFGYTIISHNNKDVNYVRLFNMIMMKYCLSFQ